LIRRWRYATNEKLEESQTESAIKLVWATLLALEWKSPGFCLNRICRAALFQAVPQKIPALGPAHRWLVDSIASGRTPRKALRELALFGVVVRRLDHRPARGKAVPAGLRAFPVMYHFILVGL
jgi:hypothetical protein